MVPTSPLQVDVPDLELPQLAARHPVVGVEVEDPIYIDKVFWPRAAQAWL